MDIQNDTPDTDYDEVFDSAFGEATGDQAPVDDIEHVESDNDVDTGEDGETDLTGDPEGGDQPQVDIDEGDEGGAGDGDTDEGGEAQDPAPTPAPQAAVEPVTQAPAPQAPIDPKYLAAAIVEYQQKLSGEQQVKDDAAQPTKDYTADDFLTDEQRTALKGFESEWPEVRGPVMALIQAHTQAALANQEKKLLSQVHQTLAPMQQITAESKEAMHYATIQSVHPDWRERVAEVKEWIGQQPSLVRPALERVYQQGSAEEVVELFNAFKQVSGMTGAAPAQPASSAAQVPPRKVVSKGALKATVAPPTATRSTPVNTQDPNDFEGAFEEAVGGR